MAWEHIHSYAEEAALWTTLVVNSWIISTGVAWLALRAIRGAGSNVALVLDAATWALIVVFWGALISFILGLFVPGIGNSVLVHWLRIGAICAGLISAAPGLWDLYRSRFR